MDPLKEETQYYERFKDMLGELEQLHLAEVGQLQVQVLELQKRLGESYFGPRCASPVKAIQPHADSRPQTEGLGPEVSHLEVPPSPVPEALQLDEPTSVTSGDADGEAAKPAVAKLKRDGSASAQSLVSSILDSIDDEDVSGDLLANDPKWLERTRHLFMGPRFEFSVCLLLVVNLILMAVQLQFHGMGVGHSIGYSRFDANPKELYPFAEDFFYYADLVFAIVFTLEMMIRWFVIRWDFWRHCLNWIDFLVVVSSWVELFAAALPISPTFLRMMRLGKLLRALRVVRLSQVLESLQLLLKCIVASLRILFWSLVLLMIIQCSAGMTISYMLSDYMSDPARADESARYEVFRYYGTFSKTILTMFEVLFANWAPACRVLIDNVSEAYSLAFIIYRCFVGFAVLNVVNAVFVQSTMKVALADDEIVANEKARAQAAYTRRVNALFKQADTSGDGVLDLEEFLRLLDSPQLQVWLHMIELDTTDLLGLFKMLDDGDGEISLDEFQEGMKKMKGMAKSLDLNKLQHEVAKLHVKVDCLFGSSAGPAIFKATKHLSSSFGSTASRARARLKKNQV